MLTVDDQHNSEGFVISIKDNQIWLSHMFLVPKRNDLKSAYSYLISCCSYGQIKDKIQNQPTIHLKT